MKIFTHFPPSRPLEYKRRWWIIYRKIDMSLWLLLLLSTSYRLYPCPCNGMHVYVYVWVCIWICPRTLAPRALYSRRHKQFHKKKTKQSIIFAHLGFTRFHRHWHGWCCTASVSTCQFSLSHNLFLSHLHISTSFLILFFFAYVPIYAYLHPSCVMCEKIFRQKKTVIPCLCCIFFREKKK